MITHCDYDRVNGFLQTLECLNMAGQKEAFAHEVHDTGGIYTDSPADNKGGRYLYEITLHEIYAVGLSEGAAIALWKRAARAVLAWQIEDDGYITVHPPFPMPRNHGEEIANARAELGLH